MAYSRNEDLEEFRHEGIETLSLMLERAGFHNYSRQRQIHLDGDLGTVRPTFFFSDPNGHYEGICVFLQRDREQRSTAVDELHRLFFEIIEIKLEDLTDVEAMRAHFFRLARALYGRDSAARVRDDISWFSGEPAQPAREHAQRLPQVTTRTQRPPTDAWSECIDLLQPKWRSLAQALRDAGLPGPTDVDWEIPVGGRVGEKRAVMMWQNGAENLALVEGHPMNPTQISVSPSSDASVLASLLIQRLLRNSPLP